MRWYAILIFGTENKKKNVMASVSDQEHRFV